MTFLWKDSADIMPKVNTKNLTTIYKCTKEIYMFSFTGIIQGFIPIKIPSLPFVSTVFSICL